MSVRHNFIRSVLFILTLIIVFLIVEKPFGVDNEGIFYRQSRFSKEKPGSLDGVCIGGSEIHAFWQPAFGWADNGISVWNYSIDGLSAAVVQPLLAEIRRTQPDSLYIISLNTFKKDNAENSLEKNHRVADYLPLSLSKINIIRQMCRSSGYTFAETLELFFPIIRFHSRWYNLKPWAFGLSGIDYKASFFNHEAFLGYTLDNPGSLTICDDRLEVPDDVRAALEALLDYCDRNRLNVLFVKMPQMATAEQQGRMNALEDIVSGRGYPCLDLLEHTQDLGLDGQMDYYNDLHTNVHGSLKVSRYLGRYLAENYAFKDKRGEPGWKDWDKAAERYLNYLRPYLMPFEDPRADRCDLLRPGLMPLSVRGTTIDIAWNTSKGADGYEIFRRNSRKAPWESVADVPEGELPVYRDQGLEPDTAYAYTVVPYLEDDGGRKYGHFDINGIAGVTGGKTE